LEFVEESPIPGSKDKASTVIATARYLMKNFSDRKKKDKI